MIISIDIGGTYTRVYSDNKDLVKFKTTTFQTTFNEIYKVIVRLSKRDNITKIGISCCGSVDYRKQKILIANNLSDDWQNLELGKKFKEAFPNTVIQFDNDVNVAALGQYLIQPIKPESLVYITFSTGIGGGLILNHQIYHGFTGQALEISNSAPDYENSNESGIEYWFGGNGLIKQFNKVGLKVNSTKECFDLYYQGDKKALEIFKIGLDKCHSFLSTLIYILNPEIIVIGGSVALMQKTFFDKLIARVLETVKDISAETKIIYAQNLDESTLLACLTL